MAMHVHIEGSIEQEQILELQIYCKDRFHESVRIRPVPRVLGISAETAAMISGPVAAIIAFISLLVQVKGHLNEKIWTMSRLKEEVATECARLGYSDTQVVELENFASLLDASDEPCKLRLQTKPNQKDLVMYVYYTGEKYTIKVQ